MTDANFPAGDISAKQSGAWKDFHAGNYAAVSMAPMVPDPTLEALSIIMSGAVERGLSQLSTGPSEMPLEQLYKAYGLWCLNRGGEALECLSGLDETPLRDVAANLLAALGQPEIDVLLLHMPNSDKAADYTEVPGFRIFPVSISPDAFGITMAEVLAGLPPGARPRIALSIDAFGPYLPLNFSEAGLATVFWVSDHDYFISTRYADLAAADVIIVNGADEHEEISAIYHTRVASIPGHDIYRQRIENNLPVEFQHDILFTGRAFVPYMADKARFLARFAMLDSPAEISIIDDYLPDDDYRRALGQARLVPVHCRYGRVIQTRAMEALSAGAGVILAESADFQKLLGEAAKSILNVDEGAPEKPVLEFLSRGAKPRDRGADPVGLFWPSPRREERFLKFSIFQALLAAPRPGQSRPGQAVPVELRGYPKEIGVEVYTAIASANLAVEKKTAGHYNFAAAAGFYAAILQGDSQDLGLIALNAFRLGRTAYPGHLALAFNNARVLWLFGQKEDAIGIFAEIAEANRSWDFDPRSDLILSHRTRLLAEMFAYGEYYRAVARGLAMDEVRFADARRYILAGAETYLGDAALEHEGAGAACRHYRSATTHAGDAFPAWIRLAKGLDASGGPAAEVLKALARAIEIYPPALIPLLPIGVTAHQALGEEGAALDLIGQWVRLAYRTRGMDHRPKPVPRASLETALGYRGGLGVWANALGSLTANSEAESR